MIGWLIFGGYLVGWVLTAAVTMWAVAAHVPHCHGEGSYKWAQRSDCKRYCAKGCWRIDGELSFRSVALGALGGVIWPAALLLLAAVWVASRAKPAAISSERRIAELERELGIGADQ
jgi:hypothetical protein